MVPRVSVPGRSWRGDVFLSGRGLGGESFPLACAANQQAWTAQTTFAMLCPFLAGEVITGVAAVVTAAPSTPADLTKANVGVWDSSGNLLASSADVSVSFQGVGRPKCALSAAYAVGSDRCLYVGVWMDGTAMPSLARNGVVTQTGAAFSGGVGTGVTRTGDAAIPDGSAWTAANTGIWFGWY